MTERFGIPFPVIVNGIRTFRGGCWFNLLPIKGSLLKVERTETCIAHAKMRATGRIRTYGVKIRGYKTRPFDRSGTVALRKEDIIRFQLCSACYAGVRDPTVQPNSSNSPLLPSSAIFPLWAILLRVSFRIRCTAFPFSWYALSRHGLLSPRLCGNLFRVSEYCCLPDALFR